MDNRLKADQFEQIDFPGGIFYRANHRRFPPLRGLAVQKLKLEPGAIREPHSHPNAEQLDYCISGKARVGIVGPEGHKQLLDLKICPGGHSQKETALGAEPLHNSTNLELVAVREDAHFTSTYATCLRKLVRQIRYPVESIRLLTGQ